MVDWAGYFASNISRLHTTVSGRSRISQNLSLDASEDAVEVVKSLIMSKGVRFARRGKNCYIGADGCRITMNVSSLTVITAHRKRESG
ncbi:MAG TPA: conjugal transfer protein [Porphyromonadaceae bacterium]|nr:conjugal transfer protein [Porphyromonadaceae bacterium]